jgi:hypothetical protein
MNVLVVFCPLILLDAISIPTIAEYCDKEHHIFATAVGNHVLQL